MALINLSTWSTAALEDELDLHREELPPWLLDAIEAELTRRRIREAE